MMNTPEIYIAIAIVVLAIIAIFAVYMRKKPRKQPSKLAMLAILLVVAGIVFGDDRLIGYSLIGVGVILGIIDIIKNLKK